MVRRLVVLLAMLAMTSSVAAQKQAVIQRENAALRAGPGSYHAVLTYLTPGTRVETLEQVPGWLQVRVDTLVGYVSQRAITEKNERRDVFGELAGVQTQTTVSPHSLSAAVKGFTGPISRALQLSRADVDAVEGFHVDYSGFQAFRRDTYRTINLRDLRLRHPLKGAASGAGFEMRERAMGLVIASKVSRGKLMQGQEAVRYINYVGQLVVQASDAYDLRFLFLIVDDESANALACPGGIVLVTTGLLKLAQTEAELAFLLSHEVAHVSLRHGLKEMQNRRVQIRAEDRFAELAGEMGDSDGELSDVEDDLAQMALDMYENIVGDRLLGYESEADAAALLYGLRAGYDPQALAGLLGRLASARGLPAGDHFRSDQGAQRLKDVRRQLAKIRVRGQVLTNRERYEEFVRLLP